MIDLSIGELLYIPSNDAIYRVIDDKTKSKNPMDYTLQNIHNQTDKFSISKVQLKETLGKSWKKVNMKDARTFNT